MSVVILTKTPQGFSVQGAVTFCSVASLRRQGDTLLQEAAGHLATYVIDLSTITECDAGSMALLFAWQRTAKKLNMMLQFTHPPDALSRMATLFGVQGFLWTN